MKGRHLFTFIIGFVVSNIFPFPAPAQTTSQAESNALLYKISGKDLAKPSYLYGTIHIICPTDMFSMDKISPHFQQTERLILELDMDDPTVMQKMLTALNMPEGKTLRDYLTPEKYAKVDEMFKNLMGIPVEMLKNLSPTGLSVVIGTSPKSTGCLIPASYETTFVEMANKNKMAVEGLETVEDQIAAINKTPLEKQAEDLFKLALEPQKALTQFKELLAIYKAQDSEKLSDFIAKESAENPEFQKNLLDERNKNWIPKIEKAIIEKPTFIAVGGGHLGGKNGVVSLLRKQGYTVTAIKF
jgi:uncharacterized protein